MFWGTSHVEIDRVYWEVILKYQNCNKSWSFFAVFSKFGIGHLIEANAIGILVELDLYMIHMDDMFQSITTVFLHLKCFVFSMNSKRSRWTATSSKTKPTRRLWAILLGGSWDPIHDFPRCQNLKVRLQKHIREILRGRRIVMKHCHPLNALASTNTKVVPDSTLTLFGSRCDEVDHKSGKRIFRNKLFVTTQTSH